MCRLVVLREHEDNSSLMLPSGWSKPNSLNQRKRHHQGHRHEKQKTQSGAYNPRPQHRELHNPKPRLIEAHDDEA